MQSPKKTLSAAEVGYKPKAPTNYYKRPIPIIKGSDIGELGYVNDGQIDVDPDATFTPDPGTYNFKMVMLKKESVHASDHRKSIFADKEYVAEGIPFRKYVSPVYDENRTHMYKGVPNGYMLDWIKTFGRPDYRVVRSHKFGNTCRDCQFVLQTRFTSLMIGGRSAVGAVGIGRVVGGFCVSMAMPKEPIKTIVKMSDAIFTIDWLMSVKCR